MTGPGTTGHQLVVERVRAIDNVDAGICLLYHNVVAGVTVKDSYAANDGGAGIRGRADITGNNVSENSDGLKISGASTIVGNIIAGNSNAGILSGNHSFDIVNHRVQGLTIGIHVFCPSLIMGNGIGGATPLITPSSAGTCTIEHNTVNLFEGVTLSGRRRGWFVLGDAVAFQRPNDSPHGGQYVAPAIAVEAARKQHDANGH